MTAAMTNVTVPLAAPGTGLPAAGRALSPDQTAKIRKSAQEFEAMAVGQMLKPMFETVEASKGLFGGGAGEAAWKPMMVDEMGKMLAKSGGIGLADAVFKEMVHMQEAGHE